MDRRWGTRHKCMINVVLDEGGGNSGLLQGKTRDISFNGAFIRLSSPEFKKNAYVDLQFWDRDAVFNPCINVGAVVVHKNEFGVGVMFNAYDERFRRYLRRYLMN